MRPLIVSFWTGGYKAAAERLIASLRRLELEHDVRELREFDKERKRAWRKAVLHKPRFIRRMMDEHPEHDPIIWIDADGIVHKKPELFWRIQEDLAAHFYVWRGKNVEELLSGTFLVRNSEKMKGVLDKWIEAVKKSPPSDLKPEQQMLQRMLPGLGVTVYKLPRAYCVMSRQTRWAPKDAPVVQHTQWSREARSGKALPPVANVVVQKRKEPVIAPKPKLRQRSPTQRKRLGEQHAGKTGKLITTRRKHIRARRQREGTDIHEEQMPYSIHTLPEKDYRRKFARIRRRRAELREAVVQKPDTGTSGGVRGSRVTAKEIQGARKRMSLMTNASELDGELDGQTVVVMGNSATLHRVDLTPLKKLPIVGCNRALRFKAVRPDYLVIADREAYCQERDEDRLGEGADAGVKLILADSIFDPGVFLRGPFKNPYRRAQPVPEFKAYLYRLGPKQKPQNYYDLVITGEVELPFAFDSFNQELVTCQNVSGSMLQTAMILGAQRIAFIGIELKWPRKGESHCYPRSKTATPYEPVGAFAKIVTSMKQAKKRLGEMGIEAFNLSPVKDSPWASVWGSYPYDRFVEEYCNE